MLVVKSANEGPPFGWPGQCAKNALTHRRASSGQGTGGLVALIHRWVAFKWRHLLGLVSGPHVASRGRRPVRPSPDSPDGRTRFTVRHQPAVLPVQLNVTARP